MSSNSGAAMSFGDGVVYFLENNTGDLWKYDLSLDTSTGNDTNEFVETSDDFSNSSNTAVSYTHLTLPTIYSV